MDREDLALFDESYRSQLAALEYGMGATGIPSDASMLARATAAGRMADPDSQPYWRGYAELCAEPAELAIIEGVPVRRRRAELAAGACTCTPQPETRAVAGVELPAARGVVLL